MAGHGWVTPLPSGAKARCGGPALCAKCQEEQRQLRTPEPVYEYPLSAIQKRNDEALRLVEERDRLRALVRELAVALQVMRGFADLNKTCVTYRVTEDVLARAKKELGQ